MKRFKSRRSYIGALIAICACVTTVAVIVGSASAGSARIAADSEISVTMGKPKEYSMKLSKSSAKAGEVALTVRNRGKITHEFILLRTPIKAGKLPARAEEPDKVEEPGFLIELEDVEPGDRVTVVMPMKKGHYVLLCNIEGHFHDGMRADLTLK